MPHVYITGAAGFIGSHLSERFLNDGWLVTGVDNYSTGSPANISGFMQHPHFRFIEQDISIQAPESPFGTVDVLLHFACPA